ncbi:hypothetical protein NQZ68_003082 [Dissostichus eleginoides]|nr:hypothetical protein NQZ68_003082 [Dissostichus eleginoides]
MTKARLLQRQPPTTTFKTKVKEVEGGFSIHGNHGDKVLGCTLSPLSGELVDDM